MPAGKYGKAALEKLGALAPRQGPAGAGRERAGSARRWSRRGEAPLGIVYRTDAAADPNVKIVGTFPETAIRRSSTRRR